MLSKEIKINKLPDMSYFDIKIRIKLDKTTFDNKNLNILVNFPRLLGIGKCYCHQVERAY